MTPTTTQTQSFGDHVFTVHAASCEAGWTVDLLIDDKHALTTVTDRLLIVALEDLPDAGATLPSSLLGLSVQLDCSSPTRVGTLFVEPSPSLLPDTDQCEYANPRRSRLAQPWVQSSLAAVAFGVAGVLGITLTNSDGSLFWLISTVIGIVFSALCWAAARTYSNRRRQRLEIGVQRHRVDPDEPPKQRETLVPQRFSYRNPPTKSASSGKASQAHSGPRRRRADV